MQHAMPTTLTHSERDVECYQPPTGRLKSVGADASVSSLEWQVVPPPGMGYLCGAA